MKRGLTKRIIFYLCGILIMALGIVLSAKAELGVAPASTIPFAASKLTSLTFGVCTSLFHVFCILTQLALTRRFTTRLVLQLPMAYVFGRLIDFFNGLMKITSSGLLHGVLLVIAGVLLFSFGLRAALGADILLLPSDSMVRAIGAKIGWPMSQAKLVCDIVMVAAAVALTLALEGSAFLAVGIGTGIGMLVTGPCIGLFQRLLPFFDVPKEGSVTNKESA